MNARNGNPLVRIGVMGVGGAGGNAVNRIVQERDVCNEGGANSVFNDIVILAANTDTQDLEKSKAESRIQLGANRTCGWGAGAHPEVGRESAEESRVEIANNIDGLDMLFITAGMGGGTGTGASPVVAEVAKQAGILTVGVVTTPFCFEGRKKMRIAQEGLEQLRAQVDTLVVIPNEKLVAIAEERASYTEMFKRSDDVLTNAVRSLSVLIANKSLVNVDFADVRTTMVGMGTAMIGIGAAAGESAAVNAVKEALNNPLLSDVSIKGARRALLHLGGMSIPIRELDEAAKYISEQLHEDADFIWGVSVDETADKVYALVVAEASQTARPPMQNFTAAATGLRGVTKDSQISMFDMTATSPAAKAETVKQNTPVHAEPQLVPEPVRTAAQAGSVSQVAVLRDSTNKVDFSSEKVLFQLPEDISTDPNDPNVPAIYRQKNQQKNADAAASAVAAPVPSVHKEPAAKRVDERQTTVFSVAPAAKNGHNQQ